VRKVSMRPLLIILVFAGSMIAMSFQIVLSAPMPNLLITELMPNPDASSIGKGDAFEYIEVYNNGLTSVNLSGYQIKYYYSPSSFDTWDLTTSFVIASETSAVIWIRPENNNNYNTSLTRNDFRAHYGLTSSELPDSRLYVWSPHSTGLGNTGVKTVVLATDTGTDIAKASYNQPSPGSTIDSRSGRGIVYQYPTDGSIQMRKEASNQQPTPGVLLDYQIPNGKELLITEIMANSIVAGNVASDAFDYVEVYNKSSSPLNLADYTLSYHWSSAGSAEWDITETMWIDPKEAAVIWIIPGNNSRENGALTKNDFRSTYGNNSAVLPDSSLYMLSINTPALGNSGKRWAQLTKDSGELIAKAQYNAASDLEDTGSAMEGKSITYKYPFGNHNEPSMMRKVANNQTPSPGLVSTDIQVPSLTQPGSFYYYGNLHAHTSYSDGAVGSTPQSAMQYVRNSGKADFFAITDHTHYYHSPTDNNKVKWDETRRMAKGVNADEEFVAFAGFEMTWAAVHGRYGHLNTFATDWYINPYNELQSTGYMLSMTDYFAKLKEFDNRYSISQFNHPSDQFGYFEDFNQYDPVIDSRIPLIELRGSEHDIYYTRALDKGWHVAPSNNQDNHAANWITRDEGRVVIVAPRNTKEDLFEAIRKRRTYSTWDQNAQIMFTINDEMMGARLNNPDTLRVKVDAYDPDPVDRISTIELWANGNTKVDSWSGTASTSVVWTTTLKSEYSYYFVRIMQTDGDTITTAPIWTDSSTIASSYAISEMKYTSDPTKSISAAVSNFSTSTISNVVVEFFKDHISSANQIGQITIPSIAANSFATAVWNNWKAPMSGSYKLYSKATIPMGSANRAFVGYVEVPELLITEIVAGNGAAKGGKDAYEFIEVFNNSSSSINLQNYKIAYWPGTLDTIDWDITTDKMIEPGDIVVLWAQTSASSGKTLSDFNAKYGTSLSSSQLYELHAGDGINNTSTNRLLFIMKDDGTRISKASLNNGIDSQAGEDVTANLSVVYEYPKTGLIDMRKKAAMQTPSPGTTSMIQTPPAALP
jgi:hypothetical protein